MILTIHYQGEAQPTRHVLDTGWNYLRWSIGVWVFNGDEALLTNGVVNSADGCGAVFVRRIVAEGEGGMVVLAEEGHHVLHPRCLLPIRTKGYLAYRGIEPMGSGHLPRSQAKWTAHYDGVGDVMLNAYESGEPAPGVQMYAPRMGPWMPLDESNPGAPGGHGLEPLPGWDRSSLYRILGCDLSLHRMAVANVCHDTGDLFTPVLNPGEYNLSRGWSKTTQLSSWCYSLGASWEDERFPITANDGSCPYFNQITGQDRWSGYLPHDGQHLVRGIRHAQAARDVWLDPIAKKALELIAHDALMAWGHLPQVVSGGSRHQGAAWAGRELGWVLHLAYITGNRERAGIITRALACVEMQSGLHQRFTFGSPWGFAPDPWRDYGVPVDMDCAQSIEAGILAWGLGWTDPGQAKRILSALMVAERPPKSWVTVAGAGMPAFSKHAMKWYGTPETFNIWYAIARAMESEPGNRQWQRYALMVPPPGQSAPKNSLQGLYQSLVSNPYITHTAAAIKQIEAVLG